MTQMLYHYSLTKNNEKNCIIVRMVTEGAGMSAQASVGIIITSTRLSDWIPLRSRVGMLILKVLDWSLRLLQVYAPNAPREY